jgi:hypothetical protein
MKTSTVRSLAVGALALAMCFSAIKPQPAHASGSRYPSMGPIDRYLMANRNAEIALARSAAPDSVSRNATVLVLGKSGFETAVKGSNGFVCMVGRGWTDAIDFSEEWNPKLSGPVCLNPAAARSLLPVMLKKIRMQLAGDTPAAIAAGLRAAYQSNQLPSLESGAMSYMMSKSAYLTDGDGHNTSHVMLYLGLSDGSTFGADLPKVPISSSSYWFPDDAKNPLERGLPTIRVFVVGVKRWSDGSVQAAKPIK